MQEIVVQCGMKRVSLTPECSDDTSAASLIPRTLTSTARSQYCTLSIAVIAQLYLAGRVRTSPKKRTLGEGVDQLLRVFTCLPYVYQIFKYLPLPYTHTCTPLTHTCNTTHTTYSSAVSIQSLSLHAFPSITRPYSSPASRASPCAPGFTRSTTLPRGGDCRAALRPSPPSLRVGS